jgi:hypothetical protein
MRCFPPKPSKPDNAEQGRVKPALLMQTEKQMKKYLFLIIALSCVAVYAAQDTALTQKEVRDPRVLEVWLETNASDAQTRIANLESSTSVTATVSGDFTVTSNLTVSGTSTLTGTAIVNAIDTTGAADIDIGSADVTDVTLVTAGGSVVIAGTITLPAAALIDATGAVDMDYGSADITDHTFTSDGGTVVLDGSVVASDDITCDKIIFVDEATAAPTNAISAGFLISVNGTNYWMALYPVND